MSGWSRMADVVMQRPNEMDVKVVMPRRRTLLMVRQSVRVGRRNREFTSGRRSGGGREANTPSAAPGGQPERGHLLAVANEQDVACQHRVVPGLAFDRRESGELRELI